MALGALASLGGATAATAAPVPDPQTTNIPYVAWRGEQLKLVKCGLPAGTSKADFLIEGWSGSSQRDPQIEPSSVSVSGGCARGDVVSLTDGLARVKLVTYDSKGAANDKHQFLAIWLTLGTPSISEVADPGNTLADTKAELGDPSGDGKLKPNSKDGRVDVKVTGSFQHPLGPGGRFTLPNDWPTIAKALATDTLDGDATNDAQRWDIHDTQSGLPDVHVPGSCAPVIPATRDQVDTCQGGGDLGPLSRVFGDSASGAAGPFDPQRLGSLLSDGALDADDAPMPAARIDVQIARNGGGATDISGAGGLRKADKSVVDSRDHNGSSAKHNLYAPYYVQWIPATSAGGNASGVDGPAKGNNFEGFLVNGPYDNWDIARVNTPSVSADTLCNRLIGQPRRTPAGPRDVAVYTDEHGEAQVSFNPNTGFYYDALRDAAGNPLLVRTRTTCVGTGSGGHGGGTGARMRRVTLCALLLLSLAAPAAASAADELSATTRLDDRRFVATGPRAYDVGTEAGRYPAMGFHTRGEMGGIWTPPIKLLDGLWFGVDGEWIGPATKFTSGWGHVTMDLPGSDGLTVQRTDFVPGDARGVLVGLTFTSTGAARSFALKMDAHSELMSIYPWGETKPYDQTTFNLPDAAAVDGKYLVFTEDGTPPAANVDEHHWAAAVGTSLTPTASTTGDAFRGPQGPPAEGLCGVSGPNTPPIPDRCYDSAYGKGKGGELTYDVSVPAGGSTSVWFAVAGSETGATDAKTLADEMLKDPAAALAAKIAERERLARYTRVNLPGDPKLAQAVSWSKQNLADSVQDVRNLKLREVNGGTNYPPAKGTLERAHFVAAGFPDYPWLFATDGEYTAFASVALGQFEPIEDHLRALREASLIINGDSGKVVHEVVTDGSVYFGALADAGNTDETAKFPSAVALVWRWTGDRGFLDKMYPFAVSNLHYIDEQLDVDGDGWPEGLGNVERTGMGQEKLDNTVYYIRGLWDLADLAAARGDQVTRGWALERARDLTSRFERAWWFRRAPGYADSLKDPGNVKVYQRHWIGVTPAEVELTRNGRAVPGLARAGHANRTLDVHETSCYGDASGMFHTGSEGCDGLDTTPDLPSELHSFTLNTSIIAVGEGNYGRLRDGQQARWTKALADQMIPGVEQPGAMPEIASPSPLDGDTLNRKFPERPMVLQAWGNYGTAWPVVHQQLGVRPDLGRGRLEVVPQPPGTNTVAARNIRLGDTGSVDVSATHEGRIYETVVTARAPVRLRIGHTLPAGADVLSVKLNNRRVPWRTRATNRGLELTVAAATGRTQVLEVRAR